MNDLLFDDYRAVRAHSRAHSAAYASRFVGTLSVEISLLVALFLLESHYLLGTGSGTQSAALAALGNNCHFSHSFHSLRIAIYCKADIPRFYLDLCTLITVGAAFGGPRF